MCYHGSTADKFDLNGDYYNIVVEWVKLGVSIGPEWDQQEKTKDFYSKHAKFMGDNELVQFVFAFATKFYLEHGQGRHSPWKLMNIKIIT